MTQATRNAPVETFRLNGVSLSLFEIEAENDGKARKFYRASLDKRYRDNSGQWKSSNSWSVDDLLRLRYLLDKGIDFMTGKPVAVQ
jgi:hypothetical protein